MQDDEQDSDKEEAGDNQKEEERIERSQAQFKETAKLQ